jgi:ABC-type transport system involved in Fe-S cluster assembly fused permease/ATPase subunit
MRFYELDGGSITVNGVDIRDVPRGILRRSFGMVLQDAWLFGGTIRDNIAYGRDGATEEEIIAAASPPTPTTSYASCPTATTPSSTRKPPTCRRASASF